jgi:hypothetical protein
VVKAVGSAQPGLASACPDVVRPVRPAAAVLGSPNRAIRNRRPRHDEIGRDRTVRANLRQPQPDYRTVVSEARIGHGRRTFALREIVPCVDPRGSMASSVVHAGIFGVVLASLPAVRTHLVAFEPAVLELTEELDDPVDDLFGTQLGGGNDIDRALGYCRGLVRRPQETILVRISDLDEGDNQAEMLRRAASFVASGVPMVALLGLGDEAAPSYDHHVAGLYAPTGLPAFACTPNLFPELMAAVINRQDLGRWAAARDSVAARGRAGPDLLLPGPFRSIVSSLPRIAEPAHGPKHGGHTSPNVRASRPDAFHQPGQAEERDNPRGTARTGHRPGPLGELAAGIRGSSSRRARPTGQPFRPAR